MSFLAHCIQDISSPPADPRIWFFHSVPCIATCTSCISKPPFLPPLNRIFVKFFLHVFILKASRSYSTCYLQVNPSPMFSIGSPQQTSSPAPVCVTTTSLPQILHLYFSPSCVIFSSFYFISEYVPCAVAFARSSWDMLASRSTSFASRLSPFATLSP